MPRDQEGPGKNAAASTIIYSEHEIDAAINRVSCQICEWISSEEIKSLNVIPILMGARRFAEELLSRICEKNPSIDVHVLPVKVSATRNNVAEGKATLCHDAPTSNSLGNRATLIVDDLVDTGASLKLVKDVVGDLGIADVKTTVLINKYKESKLKADFVGLDLGLEKTALLQSGVSDYWLFGFGMDIDGSHREMEHICWVPIENGQ